MMICFFAAFSFHWLLFSFIFAASLPLAIFDSFFADYISPFHFHDAAQISLAIISRRCRRHYAAALSLLPSIYFATISHWCQSHAAPFSLMFRFHFRLSCCAFLITPLRWWFLHFRAIIFFHAFVISPFSSIIFADSAISSIIDTPFSIIAFAISPPFQLHYVFFEPFSADSRQLMLIELSPFSPSAASFRDFRHADMSFSQFSLFRIFSHWCLLRFSLFSCRFRRFSLIISFSFRLLVTLDFAIAFAAVDAYFQLILPPFSIDSWSSFSFCHAVSSPVSFRRLRLISRHVLPFSVCHAAERHAATPSPAFIASRFRYAASASMRHCLLTPRLIDAMPIRLRRCSLSRWFSPWWCLIFSIIFQIIDITASHSFLHCHFRQSAFLLLSFSLPLAATLSFYY